MIAALPPKVSQPIPMPTNINKATYLFFIDIYKTD